MAASVSAGGASDTTSTTDSSSGGTDTQSSAVTSGQGGATSVATMTGAGGSTGGGGGSGHAADAAFCLEQLDYAAEQYRRFITTYDDPNTIPRSVSNNTPRIVGTGDWTSGFPAGSLWYLFEHTGDASFRSAAQARTDALYGQRLRTSDHDVGFIIGCSYGNGYRLTGNEAYIAVLTTAAESLVSRYNAAVGAIRSWDFGSWTYPVIIDNMMNLELLFRAAELGGSSSFADVANAHAQTTLANHFRADHSSYHVLDYNPSTGAVISKQTNQGLNDESAWARGQAWGLYGYTMSYRETSNSVYLDQALAIADFYTQSDRMAEDGIPYFDFDAPVLDNVPDYRDASAGAIAASALLELSGFAPEDKKTEYLAFALRALRSLSSTQYRANLGENGNFLLMHSVGNYPISDEIDVAINYADYYYLEALLRCSRLN